MDYVTSSGVKENKIGFANKIDNFGVEILDEGALRPTRPKNDHNAEKHDDETIPDDDNKLVFHGDKDEAQTDQNLLPLGNPNPSHSTNQKARKAPISCKILNLDLYDSLKSFQDTNLSVL